MHHDRLVELRREIGFVGRAEIATPLELGFQCAFCMPGFIMSTVGYLKTNSNPTRQQLAQGISGNLCRCQDYDKILTAMMRGAENLRKA